MDQYSKIKTYLDPSWNIPENFFTKESDENKYCVFLLSCLSDNKYVYLDESFEIITGYHTEKMIKGGPSFWFSLVHPDDMGSVSEKIVEAHKSLFSGDYNKVAPPPMVLTYRIKRADGKWLWIKETKFLVSFIKDKVIDNVLGKFEEMDIMEILNEEKSCTELLEVALLHKNAQQKQSLNSANGTTQLQPSITRASLTKREKQILQLIGEGLSTKMIADRCHISINTVETHRRHLLEKLNVKNSMELIKEASKIFWL